MWDTVSDTVYQAILLSESMLSADDPERNDRKMSEIPNLSVIHFSVIKSETEGKLQAGGPGVRGFITRSVMAWLKNLLRFQRTAILISDQS